MDNNDRKDIGIYRKFAVSRTDGKDQLPTDKHYGCEYFVLDLTCDPFAIEAIEAYALACQDKYPVLSDELLEKAAMMRANREAEGQP